MKRATIKDIASKLSVSVSTVSRALNDHPDISDKVKAEVREVAAALNYHANLLAVNLRNSRSGLVALIIPEITMFFFPSVIKGVEETVRQKGYQLLVLQSNDSRQQEEANLRTCYDLGVDGVLISLANESQDLSHFQDLNEAHVPIILFDKNINQTDFDQVIIDDEAIASRCTTELIKAGCKSVIGVFGHEGMNITRKRVDGYKKSLAEAGRQSVAEVFAVGQQEVSREIVKLLATQQADGFFCMSDETIAGVYGAYAMMGQTAQGVTVCGISDGHLPYFMTPQARFVKHSGYDLGQLAAKRLLQRLALKAGQHLDAETIFLPCEFVIPS